jgi:uncharacterized protein
MPAEPTRFQGFVPSQAPIDAYGNGGFRFADMSHKGSMLCLGDGMHAWDVTITSIVALDTLAQVLARLAPPQFLLLGTGAKQIFPPAAVVHAFRDAGIGLDAMDTGAACRTYNILLAEKRPVTAALLAVE